MAKVTKRKWWARGATVTGFGKWPTPPAPKTLGQIAEEYLDFKRGKGKRSIAQDEQLLKKLQANLGADTPVAEITAQRNSARVAHEPIIEPSRDATAVRVAG